MGDDSNRTTHPSYAIIRTARSQHGGRGVRLFGSSILHHHTVSLTIARASVDRSHNRDWTCPGNEIITVRMSEAQFGRFVSGGGIYEGVPCTITREGMEGIPEPEHEFDRERFDREFEEKMRALTEQCAQGRARVRELLALPKLNKSERAELLGLMEGIIQEFGSNVPFVLTSYNEAVEATTEAAKREVEAHIMAAARAYEGTALGAEIQNMLPPGSEGDED